jgi:hypothetical protein
MLTLCVTAHFGRLNKQWSSASRPAESPMNLILGSQKGEVGLVTPGREVPERDL